MEKEQKKIITKEHDPNYKALIYEAELNRIAAWVEAYPNLETGGDLFGFWTHSGAPVIQFVLGPGETSEHNEHSFFQDHQYLLDSGQILRKTHGLQHIGEWHSHHQLGLKEPSLGDADTVFRAMETYGFSRFILGIATLKRNRNRSTHKWQVGFGCFIFSDGDEDECDTGAWVVLPGDSPVRRQLENDSDYDFPAQSGQSGNWTIRQTTLEFQPSVAPEKVQVSDTVWYSKPGGKILLQEMNARLHQQSFVFQMHQQANSETLYFLIETDRGQLKVEMPDDFPETPAVFSLQGRSIPSHPEWQGTDWLDKIDTIAGRATLSATEK